MADISSEALIIGGGMAGLSAAIYLGRSLRDTVVVDSVHSMAVWEPDVQNYPGFPGGVSGEDLLERGREQARRFGARIEEDEIEALSSNGAVFQAHGTQREYEARRVLVATGLTHLPPDIPGVRECLGKSLFFCKDCDALRVRGKRIGIIGWNNETADYALAMLAYSPSVLVATNGRAPRWDAAHDGWLREYGLVVRRDVIVGIEHENGCLRAIGWAGGERTALDAIFTTRGDVYHTRLAQSLGADLDAEGQLVVDSHLRTTVRGLYAAGCVTPANCQMIIAAGQGAAAAQAINRDLFEESLMNHALPVHAASAQR